MSLLKQPYEMTKEFCLKALIYGQPGLGKSTLACSMPNPVLIDCDNGIHRLKASHRPVFLPVAGYDEVLEVLNSKDIEPFKTIIIDTAGKLLDYMDKWVIKQNPKDGRSNGQLSLQGYGSRKREFIRLLKQVSTMGKHIIFVAHEIEQRDGDSRFIRPEIGGSSGGDLIKELDLVGYMEAIGKKRTISFTPTEKYYAKNSAGMYDAITYPELSAGQTNDFMAKEILGKVLSSLNEESEQLKEYNQLMDSIAEVINSADSQEKLNEAIELIGKQTQIWDSRLRSWNMLVKQAATIGLKYDKDAKQFVEVAA